MFPLYPTHEAAEQRPLHFGRSSTFSMGAHVVQPFPNQMVFPNIARPANPPLLGPFNNWCNPCNPNLNQGSLIGFKRPRSVEEASIFIGSGVGTSQLLVNGVGNGVEPIRSTTLGIGNGRADLFPEYPYQLFERYDVGSNASSELQEVADIMNKVVEKRYRRMLRNRMFPEHSRAKKLAFDAQVLTEIDQIKKENTILKKAFRTVLDMTKVKNERIRRGLPRSYSSPF